MKADWNGSNLPLFVIVELSDCKIKAFFLDGKSIAFEV